MAKPLVAIIGRPNVGKSMLFNKLTGRRTSIVEDTPGVTRDRIYGESDWCGRKFTLIDTGGIEPRTDNQILAFMRSQAQIAIDNATVIVFLCDIKTGMTAADHNNIKIFIHEASFKLCFFEFRESIIYNERVKLQIWNDLFIPATSYACGIAAASCRIPV